MAGDGLDREAVQRRAEAATPGPWFAAGRVGGETARRLVQELKDDDHALTWPRADIDFIAHARTDVPALLDALRAAEARLAESVPRSALVQVGWTHCHGRVAEMDMRRAIECPTVEPVYVLRTEGGAS